MNAFCNLCLIFAPAASLHTSWNDHEFPEHDGSNPSFEEYADSKFDLTPFITSPRRSSLTLTNVSFDDNICIDGKIAPEFFFLGAMKSGTTSLCASMFSAFSEDGLVAPWGNQHGTNQSIKELSIFSKQTKQKPDKTTWLNYYPDCDRSVRIVGTDMTPHYLGKTSGAAWMADWYGHEKHNIKFMVLLRDPLLRIFSHYNFWGRCNNQKFSDVVKGLMGDHDECWLLEQSDYARSLESWMKSFSPSQFTILPMKEYVAPIPGREAELATYIRTTLKLPGEKQFEIKKFIVRSNNPIEDELGSQLFSEFRAFLDKTVSPEHVAKVAAKGAVLFGYTGQAGDIPAMSEWIARRW